MTKSVFAKAFTQQEPLPEAAIERAVEVMRSGRLHRYNTLEGETSEASMLEQEFAEYLGVNHCLACSSGGYALHIALRAAGLEQGEPVLTNAFTLAPVPGAINNAGGQAVLVEIDHNYCVDIDHLERRIEESGSRFFLMSHMRGHLADMNRIVDLCRRHSVFLIEDCAHTMGARWRGIPSGSFGEVACFSTQTYKHLNSGEGGLLTTADPEIMARAILLSGSYMLFDRHGTAPASEYFDDIRWHTPNYSGRMDNLRAAVLRGQLPHLDANVARWNCLYSAVESVLATTDGIRLPERPNAEFFVGSSIQFRVPEFDETQISDLIGSCLARGVELKWFGRAEPLGFTSRYDSWRYLQSIPHLPNTLETLSTTLDMRIPLTFDTDDMTLIGRIIAEEVRCQNQ